MEASPIPVQELGPYYSWRREPRTYGQIISGAARRIAATWKTALAVSILWLMLPIAMYDIPLKLFYHGSEDALTPELVTSVFSLSLGFGFLALAELAWGRIGSSPRLSDLLAVVRPFYISWVMLKAIFSVQGFIFEILRRGSALKLAMLLLALVLEVRLVFSVTILQFESQSFLNSLRRSWHFCTRSFWWLTFRRIVSFLVLFLLTFRILLAIESLPMMIFRRHFYDRLSVEPSIKLWNMLLTTPLGCLVLVPFVYIFVELYIDLRVRRGEWEPQQSEPTRAAAISSILQ